MGDTPETPVAETPAPTGAVVAAKDLERDSFVETFHVREKGRRYEVAANAIANRALMQMNVAKLRVLLPSAGESPIDLVYAKCPGDQQDRVPALPERPS